MNPLVVMGATLSIFVVLVLVMGATLSNFCGASASHRCHSEQLMWCLCLSRVPLWTICVNPLEVKGATLSNICGTSASHECQPGQFLCTYC